MKRYVFPLLAVLFFLSGNAAFSQNKAIQLLDKVAAKYGQSKGISAQFTLKNTDSQHQQLGTLTGTLKMQGQRFTFASSEMHVWYDGKNQWVYLPSSNEVNLSIPDADEIRNINPYLLLTTYKKEFKSTYKGKNGKQERVELTPIKPNNEIQKVVLDIDPVQLYPVTIVIYNTNKTQSTVQVTKYQTGLNLQPSEFVFNPGKYPTAEIIDLR